MLIVESALRHDIDPEDSLWVVHHPIRVLLMRDEPLKEMYLGFTAAGIPLEIIVVQTRQGSALIHAMHTRTQYAKLLSQRRQI
ncbi:MAG: toxin [Bifidobacterium sp.]|jgi:hypothetical protein|uniref:toxin n=1 Tax=Bifidobacterium sp. TaxID=41200 RepID=UPI002353C97F|nr:toxin [Bifidobacterium tibiigranuli]